MITSIRVRNLRSLRDTGYIKIKPLTILLGANSSGKSTFLRSFPLFTQSVKKNLRGPISWFDDSLVDFGDYSTAKNKEAGKNEMINFSYKIQMPEDWDLGFRYVYDQLYHVSNRFVNDIKLNVFYANDTKGTYVSKIKISDSDNVLVMGISERNAPVEFILNNEEVHFSLEWKWNHNTNQNILPYFIAPNEDKVPVSDFYQYNVINLSHLLLSKCNRKLRSIKRVYPDIMAWTKDKEAYLYRLQNHASTVTVQNTARGWNNDSKDFLDIYNTATTINYASLITAFDRELSEFYEGCSYIAPTRAEANRYYRSQGLQVDDIDPYGKNLEEFISSMTATQEKSYNEYIYNLLKLTIKTSSSAGHHIMELATENGLVNIADVGFGYSQLLPIATKLWYVGFLSKNKQRFRRVTRIRQINPLLTTIEQPELHLHPAYQAKLADAFIDILKITKEYNSEFKLIVETHSQTMVNRIGRRIREGRISPNDVNVVLFDKELGDFSSKVSQVTFNQNGQLENWPYDFFDPDDD